MNELISIIVPVYNAAPYLKRCIESIIHQTYQKIQVILIDDGSSDDSLKICENFAERTPNVQVISQENKGVSAARNLGIKRADGDYIIFVDSDDYVDSGMCSCLLQAMQKHGSDIVISGISYFCNENQIAAQSLPCNEMSENIETFHLTFNNLFEKGLINSPVNKIYKKSLITKLFNEQISLGEDLLFNLDYLENCKKLTSLPKSFYNYRISQKNTLSSQYRKDGFEIALKQYQYAYAFGFQIWNDRSRTDAISNKLISDICTYSENLARKSSYNNRQICEILKRYFNDDIVCKSFASSKYRESKKYEVYKILLEHRLFYFVISGLTHCKKMGSKEKDMSVLSQLKILVRGTCNLSKLKKDGLTVGDNFNMLEGCIIDPGHCWLISIGENVTLAPRVHILAHDASTKKFLGFTKIGRVIIGNNVFIGSGSIILPNVVIDDNTVIGAGSVVTKNCKSGVYAGNPAKYICSLSEYLDKERDLMSHAHIYDKKWTIGQNITKDMKDKMIAELCDGIGFVE
jgi:Glycosyltransferases involved in cell wall biogenesis